jgi:hypothetical protein
LLISGGLALAGAGIYWYLTKQDKQQDKQVQKAKKYHGIVIFGV